MPGDSRYERITNFQCSSGVYWWMLPVGKRLKRANHDAGFRLNGIGVAFARLGRHRATQPEEQKEDAMDLGFDLLLGNVLMAIFLYVVVKLIWQ